MRVCLQLDDVLKDLGPKQNPDQDSDIRLIPAAKVVGEGVQILPGSYCCRYTDDETQLLHHGPHCAHVWFEGAHEASAVTM